MPELPIRAYVDAADYAREIDRVWHRSWVPATRANELPEAGAFRTLELAGSPVVVLRDEAGELRAFHNVCRHRGAQILRESTGSVSELVCPYHNFRYALEGAFRGAPSCAGVDARATGLDLVPVAVAEHGGWAWVHLGPGAPSLATYLGPATDELARWPLAALVTKQRRELEVAFNWKVGVEAFLEPLHVPAIHGASAHPFVDVTRTRFFELGEHSGMAIPFRDPDVWTHGPLGEIARAAGIAPFAGLDDEQLSHHLVYLLFPATILMVFPNHLLALTFLPLAVDRTRLVVELLAEPAGSEAAATWYRRLEPGYEDLLREDLENLPWIQKGLAGGSLERLALTELEQRIASFRSSVAARLQND